MTANASIVFARGTRGTVKKFSPAPVPAAHFLRYSRNGKTLGGIYDLGSDTSGGSTMLTRGTPAALPR